MKLINITDNELKILSEKLYNIKKYGVTEETIKDALLYLIPDKNIIGIDINDKNAPAQFDLNVEKINISITRLTKMIKESINRLLNYFPDINQQEMFYYYILFSLIHETRHVWQYLIAENKVKFPYEVIKQVYKEMSYVGQLDVGFIKNIKSFYLYTKKRERLVIERNVNIEATETILNLAHFVENKEIEELFSILRKNNILYGYEGVYNGSIEETYKLLGLDKLYDKLPKGETIPIKERILYGLPINEVTKKKVLNYEI